MSDASQRLGGAPAHFACISLRSNRHVEALAPGARSMPAGSRRRGRSPFRTALDPWNTEGKKPAPERAIAAVRLNAAGDQHDVAGRFSFSSRARNVDPRPDRGPTRREASPCREAARPRQWLNWSVFIEPITQRSSAALAEMGEGVRHPNPALAAAQLPSGAQQLGTLRVDANIFPVGRCRGTAARHLWPVRACSRTGRGAAASRSCEGR